MRKKLLSCLLLAWLLPVGVFADKEDLYVLHEGFEGGAIPADWSQEYVSSYQQSWMVEKGAESSYPTGAQQGDYHVALRNQTTQTQHFVTRLVTPVFDVSETFQPIVVFSHAQLQRTGDVDALRVYYRTSASARWVKIGEFVNKTKGWTTDTIALTAPTATYQLAFEGTDNFGQGIVLDEIIVRPTPTCNAPSNITIDGLTVNSVILRWNGSLDTDSFRVVLSKKKIENEEFVEESYIVKDTFVYDFQCSLSGLTQNTLYYAYLQANCAASASEWVETSFSTKNLVNLPYKQTFDCEYAPDVFLHIGYWSYGTNILLDNGTMEWMPFVNQNTKPDQRKPYSYSQTSCLVFTGARSISTRIPAGSYVYAATPELNTENVSNLQVSFWGTCRDYIGDDYVSGLIVGVMTDPVDYNTFFPVDTVYVTKENVYEYFTVRLNNYKGTGKYIAFASDFKDKANIFYLDDVEIKQQKNNIKPVSDIRISNYGAASFSVDANLQGNSRVELWVTKNTTLPNGTVFLDPAQMAADNVLLRQELDANELPYKVQLSKGGYFVQVYMRAVEGTEYSEFALPEKAMVPMQLQQYPFFTEFKETDPTGIWKVCDLYNYYSTAPTFPYPFSVLSSKTTTCNNTWAHMMDNVMLLRKAIIKDCVQEIGDYIAFPAITEKNVMMRFTMNNRGSSATDNARVAVGMMTDPFDITTFDTVAVCESPDHTFRPYIVSFDDYKGEGVFPAIMAMDADNVYVISDETYTCYASINDVTISRMEGCIIPSDFQAIPSYDKITLKWNDNGMQQWVVKLYVDDKGTILLKDTALTTPECVFENLKPHTKYYYSVHTKCDETLTDGTIYEVITECVPAEPIPYIEDFESWVGGTSNKEAEPFCWTMNRLVHRPRNAPSTVPDSYDPYISPSGAYNDSKKCFVLTYSSDISRRPILYVALPEMAKPLNELQLSFYAKPNSKNYVGDTLFIGAMTNPNDITTFDTIAKCRLSSIDYAEYIVRLNTYSGEGKHLAFAVAKGKETRTIYLDNIKVDYLADCEKVLGVTARNATETGADISWQKGDATKWEVLLATTDTLTLGSVVTPDGTKILSIKETETMPFTLDNCPNYNTKYAVYVRSVCSETNKGEWSNPVSFKTTCVAMAAGLRVIDFSNQDELDCWTVGVLTGKSSAPSRNANGYLYMYNTDASDGAYAIMPPLDIDNINKLQVSFTAHGGDNAKWLREITVGVISNPADLSTFVSVATLSLNKVSSTLKDCNFGFDEAATYTVRFNEYEGDYNGDYGKQIMFLSESGDQYNYVYIDNIRVDTIGACMEPVSVEIAENNANDVTIQWDDLGGDYQLLVLNPIDSAVLLDTLVRDKHSVQIEGLQMLTKYAVQVRHICGVGDTSVWSNMMTFKTACPVAYPLPYKEDFEQYISAYNSLPDCWEGFTSSSSGYPRVYKSAAKDGNNGFELYRSTSYYSYAVLPKFEVPVNQLMLSFDCRSNSTSNAAYFVVGVATDVTSVAGIDTTFTQIDSVMLSKYVAANGWEYYSKIFDEYTGKDGYIVLIAPKADVSANSGEVYIDNVYVEKAPTCFRPLNLSYTKTTTQSVTLTWEPFGKETAWDVAYVSEGGNIVDATIVPADADTFEVTGLKHTTNYDFYVRANCGNGDVSDWSDPVTVNTLYFVELADAHWDFDNTDTQYQIEYKSSYSSTVCQYENGWLFGNTKTNVADYTYIPYNIKDTKFRDSAIRQNHYSHSDSCALRVYSTIDKNGTYAVLPEINADLNDLQIRFFGRALYANADKATDKDVKYSVVYSKAGYPHSIKIGTLTDPYDLSTFQLLTDYTFKEVSAETPVVADGHWEEVVVSLYGAKGKYIAFISDYSTNSNSVYIDDVVIEKESGCNFITGLTMTDLTANSANIEWISPKTSWQVELRDADGKTLRSETTDKSAYSFTGLDDNTGYIVAVRAVCDDATFSEWVTLDIQTPCTPFVQETMRFNFEDNLYTYIAKLELPQCWEAGQLIVGGSSTSNLPQAIKNTTTYQYSRNITDPITDGRALRLYNTSTYADSYVILPETDFKLDSVCLHFWARAAYFYTSTYSTAKNRNRLYGVNKDYQKSIVIGVISDIEDPSTFEPLDTFTYSQSWTSTTNVYTANDPTGNDYWEEVLIPLKKYAGKGRIAILYPANGKTSYFFIDDMEIIDGNFCTMATSLRIANLRSTSADLSWVVTGNDSVRFQLATAEDFNDKSIIVDKIMVDSEGRYTATNLRPGQAYWFRVQHLCSEEETADWAISNKFITDYAVRFAEDFSALRIYPVNWWRAEGVPDNIFSGDAQLKAVEDDKESHWVRSAGGGSIAKNDIYVNTTTGVTTAESNDWLISPVIDLMSLPEDEPIMLSFRLGLTNKSNGTANPTGVNDKFIVAVSEDEGSTWISDTYWSDAVADNAAYSYKAIPSKGQLYYLDMSKYIGKRIQIAFINPATEKATNNRIHLATVQLNKVFTDKYQSSICQWEDYEDKYFSIDANDLNVGTTTTYDLYTQATRNGQKDTHVVLDLTVRSESMTNLETTVCEGADYTLDGFDIHNALSTNQYKQKLQNADGCDSIVVLTLNVTPRIRTNVEQTICQGDYYEFNGNRYYINTVHTDTLSSLLTGCDSIVTLYLTVNEILRGETDEHLCPGETVEFGKFGTISEAGKYIDTLKTALNCDSVATLYVYTHESAATVKRAAICQGDRYEDSYWAGLSKPGDYPTPHQTVWGCDSIVTLHLMVANLDNSGKIVLVDSVEVGDLPYVLNDEELLPATATEGVYTRLIKLACGDAIITIVVGKPTGLNSVFATSLAIMPNPVMVGQDIQVLGSFDSDAVLEVISTTGTCVYRNTHLTNPIVIPGLPVAGAYLVTITSNGQLYQAKLVVK